MSKEGLKFVDFRVEDGNLIGEDSTGGVREVTIIRRGNGDTYVYYEEDGKEVEHLHYVSHSISGKYPF